MSIKLIVSLAGSTEPMSEHTFEKDLITVGRTLGNDIVLPDVEKKVSSKHARLERKGAGCELVDLGSTNGTYVNGRRIEPNRPLPLQGGDKVMIGGFQILFQATEDKQESTQRHIDPTKAAEKLADTLALEYAKHLNSPPDQRKAAIREAIRNGLQYAGPENGRTVLTLVRARFQAGAGREGGGEQNQEIKRQEDLYRSGYQAISTLSEHFLGDGNFQSADQVERFSRQIEQVFDLTMDWVANMLKGRREFENQFQADLTMVFSKEGNPLKSAGGASDMARHLLDWRSAREPEKQKLLLENAFKDIAMHQLGLVAGAQACLKKLLEKLDPKVMEAEAVGKGGGFLKSAEKKAWELYTQRHKEMFEENSKLFNELIYPNLRDGYLKSHAGEAAASPGPGGPSSRTSPGLPPAGAGTIKQPPPGASTVKPAPGSVTAKPAPAPPGSSSATKAPPPPPPPPKGDGK